MAFITKEWKDRIVEYAGRRRLTNVSTQAQEIVDVERAEGTVSQAGDAFSAANMNDLEQRISDEFTAVNENLSAIDTRISQNNIGTVETITLGQLYTCPNDGYLRIIIPYDASPESKRILLEIGNPLNSLCLYEPSCYNGLYHAIFCKKGLNVKVSKMDSGAKTPDIYFLPYA